MTAANIILRRLSSRFGQHSARRYTASPSLFNGKYPPHILYPMPALSPTMESGNITTWHKKEGDEFTAGDTLCLIETDKTSVDFEAQDDGIIAKILREGDNAIDVTCGDPICVVVEEMDNVAAFKDYTASKKEVSAATTSESSSTSENKSSIESDAPAGETIAPGDQSKLMPSARHMAASQGLDASGLKGTGKGGRITKGDVIKALASGAKLPKLSKKEKVEAIKSAVKEEQAEQPALSKADSSSTSANATSTTKSTTTAPPSPSKAPVSDLKALVPDNPDNPYQDHTNNKMRKIIASRLTASKRDVPHFYTSAQVELDATLALRKQLATNHDVKVSVNDFIIRACALALRDVPEVNGTYDPKSTNVRYNESVDICVAVATPTGLITPIVPRTHELGLSDITNKVRDLATRARDGKLAPEEYQGGTFTVSNLGMFGIDEFSAVINPPQAAILAVGGGSQQVVPTPYVLDQKEQLPPQVKTIMTARLSADRRVVDEATAALFMSSFVSYLNNPQLMML